MHLTRRTFVQGACLAAAGTHAYAQPGGRELHILVGTTPGSPGDVLARALGQELSALLQRTVVVENHVGANTQIATQRLLRGPADGSQVQITTTALFTNAVSTPPPPYDTLRELRGLCQLVTVPSHLLVRAELGWRTLQDMIDACRREPGKYSYGSLGARSGPHVGVALFAQEAGLRLLHVPYRGIPELTQAFVSGVVDVAMLTRSAGLSASQGGTARIIAVTEPLAWPETRGLPALSQRYPAYKYRGIFGTVVPAATPNATVEQLEGAFQAAMQRLDASGRLVELGLQPQFAPARVYDSVIREQVALWRDWNERIRD